MEKLKNGAELIHRTPVRADYNIVLAVSESSHDPYVTWFEDARLGSCEAGRYFPDFFSAVEDYRDRILRAGGHIGR